MDDGRTVLPPTIDSDIFLNVLNRMDPSITFTLGKPSTIVQNNETIKMTIFLSLILYLRKDGIVSTDVFYKETNSHDYLNYTSHHPTHVKNNIPYVLAKRIIVFTSCGELVEEHLYDLRKWLLKCEYPADIINKGIHNAKLQGPAPLKSEVRVIPLISTYYSNYDNETMLHVAKSLINKSKDERVTSAFKDVRFIDSFMRIDNRRVY